MLGESAGIASLSLTFVDHKAPQHNPAITLL
jgi:hypothetical protein